jgi:hypothetical protein
MTYEFDPCVKSFLLTAVYITIEKGEWDLAEWLERCTSILKIMSLSPSGGSELTFRCDLLLTARGGST